MRILEAIQRHVDDSLHAGNADQGEDSARVARILTDVLVGLQAAGAYVEGVDYAVDPDYEDESEFCYPGCGCDTECTDEVDCVCDECGGPIEDDPVADLDLVVDDLLNAVSHLDLCCEHRVALEDELFDVVSQYA